MHKSERRKQIMITQPLAGENTDYKKTNRYTSFSWISSWVWVNKRRVLGCSAQKPAADCGPLSASICTPNRGGRAAASRRIVGFLPPLSLSNICFLETFQYWFRVAKKGFLIHVRRWTQLRQHFRPRWHSPGECHVLLIRVCLCCHASLH